MNKTFLAAKIRDISVTGTFLEYEGSITLDEKYIEEAGMAPFEQVQVLNLENAARFTTYVIKGERGKGQVELNGPAARLATVGDRILVLSYVMLSPQEAATHKPRIVSFGD